MKREDAEEIMILMRKFGFYRSCNQLAMAIKIYDAAQQKLESLITEDENE
jgi:hypothetical protein